MPRRILHYHDFLSKALFYPASGLDLTPVKYHADLFTSFVYVDYGIDRQRFNDKLYDGNGFRGYHVEEIYDLDPRDVLNHNWDDLRNLHADVLGHLEYHHFEINDPFIVFTTVVRDDGFGDDHGPPEFELMFIRFEGVAAYRELFVHRGISPTCLAHIRCGIGFGGNFQAYPTLLCQAAAQNQAGMPQFLLHDDLCTPAWGDYLRIIEQYPDLVDERPYRTEGYGESRLYLRQLALPESWSE